MNVKRIVMLVFAAALLCVPLSRISAQDAPGGQGSSSGPMVIHGNKLYVVSGATLACINLKTYEVEFKKDLNLIGKEKAEEEAMEKRKAYLSRYDKNKDGKVTQEEAGKNWNWLKRQDMDNNGEVIPSEVSFYRAISPAAYGNASLMISGNTLFMLRGGNLFVFDKASLDFQKSVEIEEKKTYGENGMQVHYGRTEGGDSYVIKHRVTQ